MRLFLVIFSYLIILSSHCLTADQDFPAEENPRAAHLAPAQNRNKIPTAEQFQAPHNPMHYHGTLHRGIATMIGTCTTIGLFTAVAVPTLSLGVWYYLLG